MQRRLQPINVTRNGIYYDCSGLSHDQIRKLVNMFTIRYKVNMGHLITHCNVVKSKTNMLLFPRFGFLSRLFDGSLAKLAGIYPDQINLKIPMHERDPSIEIKDPEFALKDHQKIIINHIITTTYTPQAIATGRAGLIANVDTGYGKTYIGLGMINAIKMNTLIIVHNKPQVEDWYRICAATFGADIVGTYSSSKRKDGKILITTVQSAIKDSFKFKDRTYDLEQMFSRFGFVIYDECHKYCSKSFSKVFSRAQFTFTLGLSATPKNSELYQISEWNIGPIRTMKDELRILADLKEEFTGQIQVIHYFGPPSHTRQILNAQGQSNHVAMVKQLLDDEHRNYWIAQYLINLARSGRNIYVFAVILEGLRNIRKIILESLEQQNILVLDENDIKQADEKFTSTSDWDEKLSMLTGGAKPEDIARVSKSSKIIFSTYGYMGTGKSIPRMDTILFATPHKKGTSQYIGRIFRPGPNQHVPRIIIDIVDKRLKMASQFSVRKRVYNEQEQIGRKLSMVTHVVRAPTEIANPDQPTMIKGAEDDHEDHDEHDHDHDNDNDNDNEQNEDSDEDIDIEELKRAFKMM